ATGLEGLVAGRRGAHQLGAVVEPHSRPERLGKRGVVVRGEDLDGGGALAGRGAGHQSVLRTGIRTMTWAPSSSHPSNHAPPPTRATLSLVSERPRCTPPLPLPEGPRPLSRTLSSTESPSLR